MTPRAASALACAALTLFAAALFLPAGSAPSLSVDGTRPARPCDPGWLLLAAGLPFYPTHVALVTAPLMCGLPAARAVRRGWSIYLAVSAVAGLALAETFGGVCAGGWFWAAALVTAAVATWAVRD